MKFTELKNSIAQGANSIYLIEGEDAYFRMHAESMITTAFLEMRELNYLSLEGESLKGSSLKTLTDAIVVFPFLSNYRIIKVTNFYPSESEYNNFLKGVFEDMPSTTILLIVNSSAKKGGVNLKSKKCITFVDCQKADEETVTKWIYITFKRAGIACDVGLCTLIAQYCLCNMARVSIETKKLIEFKGSGQLVREEIDDLVYKDAEYRIYEMTGAIPKKNFTLFIDVCADLLKKGMDEMALLNSLLNFYKNLQLIINSKSSDSELSLMLKQKEYAVKKQREAARQIGKEMIDKMVTLLYKLISDVKCGEINAQYAFMCAQNQIFFS